MIRSKMDERFPAAAHVSQTAPLTIWIRRISGLALLSCGTLVLSQPTHFLFDDPYFYLEIAEHIVAGAGSTFSGLDQTNGYHPLWMAACVAATAASPDPLRGALLLCVVLAGALLWGLERLLSSAGIPQRAAGMGVALIPLLPGGLWGSEGLLNGALQVAALLALLSAHARPSPGRWARVGALLGLAVLARLDLVFLGAAGCLSALAQRAPWRERLLAALLVGGTLTAVLAPYLAANLAWTGHAMPISGAIKSTFPVPDGTDALAKLGSLGRNGVIAAVLALALALLPTVSGPARRLLWVLSGATLAHAGYVVLFTAPLWSTHYDYYWMTGLLTQACVGGLLMAQFVRLLPSFSEAARGRLGLGLMGLFALLAVGLAADRALDGGSWAPENSSVRLGRTLGDALPADARVFVADAPGRLAWFSGLSVVPADGLTHDRAYGPDLDALGLTAWMAGSGISHVVAPLFAYRVPWLVVDTVPGGVTLQVIAPFSGRATEAIRLDEADALQIVADDDGRRLGVWAIPR